MIIIINYYNNMIQYNVILLCKILGSSEWNKFFLQMSDYLYLTMIY